MTLSVKDFGALGDGATDDTAAINAALAEGGAVFAPSGTYIFSGPLFIPNNGTLYGVHNQTVFKVASGAWSGPSFPYPPITNADYANGRNVAVKHIVIDGNLEGNPNPGAPGVLLSFRGNVDSCEIVGVIFKGYPGATGGSVIGGAPVGIGMPGAANVRRCRIFNNDFLNARGGAIVIFGPDNYVVKNTQIAATDAAFGAQGIYASGNVFKDNIVQNLTTPQMFSFYVEGASNNLFIDNQVQNSRGIAISHFDIAKPQYNRFINTRFFGLIGPEVTHIGATGPSMVLSEQQHNQLYK